ncbi:transcriptional regulator GutM [Parageobacillus sp. KH3-4]|jgi:glucitol operon activator protein|uniref:transcriptional regulator GutM n=1 Tax=Parageobacillus sp. KH3-4 TaxID=2916802 RepID=UPI001FCB085F|nr:transcriptional regulator GutM [Parageobacillus sp. KH3-4]BDG46044.1 sorbitol operon activator protein (glucitol) [Parageobacillus sp. KH3-4]
MFIVMLFMAAAFMIQLALGYFQIRNFTKTYIELRRKGKVAIGRRPGKFRAGTIVLFAVNNKGDILDAKKMQGVTVFAKFKKLKGFENKNILSINDNDLNNFNKLVRIAVKDAINNYKVIMNGGEIPEKLSVYRRIITKAENFLMAKK